jgi:hypothetical protein
MAQIIPLKVLSLFHRWMHAQFYNPIAYVALSKAKSATQGHLSTFIEKASHGNNTGFFLLEAESAR